MARDPGSVEILRALGSFLARRLRHDEAVAILEQAVSCAPESGEAWLDLSLALRASGNPPEAHRAAERAVTIGVPPAREKEARFTLKASATGHSSRPAVVRPSASAAEERELADLRDRLNAGDPSVETDLRALVERFPGDGRVHQYLGEFLCRMMRAADAIEALEVGAGAAPDFGPLQWSLGMALQSEGRSAEAARALRQALGLPLDANMRRNAEVLLNRLAFP
jgi:tetratricopeptide (TPR) repeat protein